MKIIVAAMTLSFFTMVNSLAYAQAVKQAGVLMISQGNVYLTANADGPVEERLLNIGDEINVGDRIETGEGAQFQIMMLDQSVVFLGETGAIQINDFNYSGIPTQDSLKLDVDKGDFRVLTGQIGKAKDTVKLNIKNAVVDISKGEVSGMVKDVSANVVLLSGIANVETNQGVQEINRSGWGIDIGNDGALEGLRQFDGADIVVINKSQQKNKSSGDFDAVLLSALSASSSDEGDETNITINTSGNNKGLGFKPKKGKFKKTKPSQILSFGNSVTEEANGDVNEESGEDSFVFLGFNASTSSIDEDIDTSSGKVKVGSFKPINSDGGDVTYAVVGAGSNIFSVDAAGNLYLNQGASLDFETSNTQDVRIRASNAGQDKNKDITLTVNDANDAPSAISLTNDTLPDYLVYNTLQVKSDNLLQNTKLTNDAEGWDFYKNKSGYTYWIEGDEYWTDNYYSHLYQTINLDSSNGFSSYDGVNGGSLRYYAYVYAGSTLCHNGGSSCGDFVKVGVKSIINGVGTKYSVEKNKKDSWFNLDRTVTITEQMEAIDYFAGGNDVGGQSHVKGNGVRLKNFIVEYTYDKAQDLVVGELLASDQDADSSHTFSISSDASGLFEVQGNHLVLNGGSELDASAAASYSLQIQVTDDAGAVSTLPITVNVNDVGATATKTTQAISATEGSAFSKTIDFGANGATVTAADLPSWLTLADLSNGRATISGTAEQSGEKSFSLTSTVNGESTTAYYVLTAAENCTGAYCVNFQSSPDTETIATYSFSGGNHLVGGVQYNPYGSWADLYTAHSTGTGTYSRQNVALSTEKGGGAWTGNVEVTVDYTNRTIQSLAYGTFSNHSLGAASNASGAFTSRGSTTFGTSGNCASVGDCSIADTTSSFTCTGSGQCSEDNHATVETAVTVDYSLLTQSASNQAALASMNVVDTANGSEQVATLSDTLLIAE